MSEALFYDSSAHTMDSKNRVFVPKRFQQVLGRDAEGVMVAFLTRGLDGCLFLFSEEGFRRALDRLDTQPFTGKEQRTMQRRFFANTSRVQLDASGRLLVPEKLRARVGLKKDVVMVGVVHRAEIWPKEKWDEIEVDKDDDFDELLGVLIDHGPDGGPTGT
jgi:MraZ protein